MYHLAHGHAAPPLLSQAIAEICDQAVARKVRIIVDAEQDAVQSTIDAWAVDLMRRYNRSSQPTIFNTYQAYLKHTPAVLAQHLSVAGRDSFTLGVKLVRGAYLASDPRHIIHDTKAQTDEAYDRLGGYAVMNPPVPTCPVRLIPHDFPPSSL